MTSLCGDDTLRSLTESMAREENASFDKIDVLLLAFPDDPRLHFLKGSSLISSGRLIEGHRSLSKAVDLAPDFAIARFQLGLFELTSGEPQRALDVWGRLDQLPDDHYLRKFVDGLRCLIRDDFAGAMRNLREGIARNEENPPLNRDMQLLLERCADALAAEPVQTHDDSVSETSFILRQFTRKSGEGPDP